MQHQLICLKTMVIQKTYGHHPRSLSHIRSRSESIAGCIDSNSDLLRNAMEQAERNRVIQNSKIREKSIVSMWSRCWASPFSTGYRIKKQTEDFSGLPMKRRIPPRDLCLYLSLQKSGRPDLSHHSRTQSETGKKVPGPLDNTYMTTTLIEPSFRWVDYNNREFVEIRGLWDVKNDFMGGPFVCHCFFDRENKNIVVLEAPSMHKVWRNYLRQVEFDLLVQMVKK